MARCDDEPEVIEQHTEEDMEKTGSRIPSGRVSEVMSPDESVGPGSSQSSHRLLAYSDALISIIATVMILPVAHTPVESSEELRQSLQVLLSTKIAVYLMTFLIVSMAWAAHSRLFQVVVRIDDYLALFNLMCMMLITLLPYTFSLMAAFPEHILGILLFCSCVMVIGLVQTVIVLYAFSRPHLLHPQLQGSPDLSNYQHHILRVILRVPLMCLLASLVASVCFQLSYVLLAIVIFLPYISRCLQWVRSKALGPVEESPEELLLYSFLPHEPLSKERLEAFSDGVYAIVATLLILDICEDNVPDPSLVSQRFNGSLVSALSSYGPEYLAYFGSFVTVGLLWFVHHSLFLHVTKVTRLMGLLNSFCLAFVGGLPLAYQLTHEFPRHSQNELEAIQISCVIIFFAGLFQLCIWVVALYNQHECLQPSVRYGGREHLLMLAKLWLYPCVALGTFLLTCVLSQFSAPIFHLMELTVPLAFLLLRLLLNLLLALVHLLLHQLRSFSSEGGSTPSYIAVDT
ncbi:endosomal/lysosomal proton channel TMEM175 [Periophthalmus magnuspinnatus]|uniref:endosomal/lysosomal proton channel TMEM175 n=1 Tax=Periophthalmus magnuspinnatus TaxID=409849 RepID=UPI00145A61CE|nr:endosomal/lysosomal proton channel TMEM175 [Periophthalmus magnuspinnatus]